MAKTKPRTEWVGKHVPNSLSSKNGFSAKEREIDTIYPGSNYNLLEHTSERFDTDQMRMAIVRAKQDYGKAFKKLAAED